ncbi:MAG: nuclear transport factor 2 family protein [Parvibaculum sp.]|uniref:nuclear transport factor 2 family protein n=1 Tax=Parvibaculum sp. TaxID=2024848 RepID=UPI003C72689A
MQPAAIENWHKVVKSRDPKGLDAILADDVVFQSPVVHKPQTGKAITTVYLTAAMHVLSNSDAFHYVGEWFGPTSAVLEFETVIDGIVINGIDMIGWNEAGKIDSFKVMVRPLKAINTLHALMGARLAEMTKN